MHESLFIENLDLIRFGYFYFFSFFFFLLERHFFVCVLRIAEMHFFCCFVFLASTPSWRAFSGLVILLCRVSLLLELQTLGVASSGTYGKVSFCGGTRCELCGL